MASFLAAKVAVPVPPSPFLVRARLSRILDRALDVTLTVVVGPPGAGKSTLVAGWIHTLPPSVRHVWVNADSADTGARLFGSIGEALTGRHDGSTGETATALLQLLRRGSRSEPVVIVIDDLSLVRSRQVTRELADFANDAPDHIHLVLISRADPSFLPGWRVRGREFVEIRHRDLRLTDAEVAAMVAAHPRVTLDDATLDDLTDKVDGWAAGLQLALASLTHSDHPDRIVASFGGATPAVAEYLLDEVLSRLDGPSRAFLLDVSVLGVLTPEACRRLTGRDDAAEVLAELARDNLLIERYSDSSYRYHPLLQQLLQIHLRRADEAHYQRLHRWAAAAAEAEGDLVGAVEHLLAAEDYSSAVALCSRDRELSDGDGTALLPSWLARIPAHAFDDLDDQLDAAELMLEAGDALGCAFRLERCHATRGARPSDAARARIARLRSHCHHRLGDPEAALRSADEAEALHARDPIGGGGTVDDVAIPRGFGLLWMGRLDEARSVVASRPRPSAPSAEDLVALGLAARIEFEAGDIPACRVLVRRALTIAEQRGLDPAHPDRLHADLAHAQLLVEAVSDMEADDAVRSLLAAADSLGARDHTVVGLILQARLRWTSTCMAAGLGALNPAARLDLDRPLSPALRALLDRFEARLRIEAGDREGASQILARIPDGLARVILESRLTAASGSADTALAALDVTFGSRSRLGFEAALARARILADRGDDETPAALRRLLEHPLAPHLRRTYLEEGEPFGMALADLIAPRAAAAIAADLERARQRTATTALSSRELAVLQFLPTRLTNQEIGAQIFVSPNTVKTHLKSLYRRLGVNSRDEAVRRARQLGLLPADRDLPAGGPSGRVRAGAGGGHVGLEGHEGQAQLTDAGDHVIDVRDDTLEGCGPR